MFKIEWYDAEQTILHIHYPEQWTWEELSTFLESEKLQQYATEVPGPYYIVINFNESRMTSKQLFSFLPTLARSPVWNMLNFQKVYAYNVVGLMYSGVRAYSQVFDTMTVKPSLDDVLDDIDQAKRANA